MREESVAPEAAPPDSSLDADLLEFFERFTSRMDFDPQESLTLARELEARGRREGDAALVTIGLASAAEVIADTEGPMLAAPVLERAAEVLPAGDPLPLVVYDLARANVHFMTNDEPELLLAFDRMARHLDELPVSILHVRVALSEYYLVGRYDGAAESLRRLRHVRRIAAESGATWYEPWCEFMEHDSLWYQGQADESIALARRMLADPELQENPRLIGKLHYSLAWIHWDQGDIGEGLTEVELAWQASAELGIREDRGLLLELEACLLRDGGELEGAMRSIQGAIAEIRGRGFSDIAPMIYGTACDIAARIGDGDALLEYTQALNDLADSAGAVAPAVETLGLWNGLSQAWGERDRERQRVEEELRTQQAAQRRIATLALGAALALALALLFVVYRSRGRLARAHERLREEKEAVEASIRARRELEERFKRLEAMQGLNLVAGGVAHDFNNLMAVTLGNAELLLDSEELSAEDVPLVQHILDSARRAERLGKRLLALGEDSAAPMQSIDAVVLVEDMLPLLRGALKNSTELEFSPPKLPIRAWGDSTQLERVLLNLVTNAEEAGANRVSVSLALEELDAEALLDLHLGNEALPGSFAVLEVRDDGAGMDEAARARLFEPFFSTRFPGRGLGLAALVGILRLHQGAVEVQSRPGEGTRVRVFVPHADRKERGGLDTDLLVPRPPQAQAGQEEGEDPSSRSDRFPPERERRGAD